VIDASKSATFATINVRSVRNKTVEIIDVIDYLNLDLLFITESWIISNDTDAPILSCITPPDYQYFSAPRLGRAGGGIVIIYRSIFNTEFTILSNDCCEMVKCLIKTTNKSLIFLIIYRPPTFPYVSFVDYLQDLILEAQQVVSNIFVVGDVNIRVDVDQDPASKVLTRMLDELGYTQIVKFPTHNLAHTLDLIITDATHLVEDIFSTSHVSSDHRVVVCKIRIPVKASIISTVVSSYRNWRNVNLQNIVTFLQQEFFQEFFETIFDVDMLCDIYE